MNNFIIIMCSVVFAVAALKVTQAQNSASPTLNNRSIKANATKSVKNLNILFIGNSYTAFHNMPSMMLELARKDPNNRYNITTQVVQYGGYTLQNHWHNQETHNTLERKKWDIVVIQQQSVWALFAKEIKNTATYVKKFTKKSRTLGAQPVLFQTWIRQPATNWYVPPQQSTTKNPKHMYKSIKTYTARIAHQNDIPYVPVGDYWYHITYKHPNIALYDPDGSHQSATGSFLTALVFYKYLTGNNPENSSYKPYKISSAHTKTLKNIVSKGLQSEQ